MKMLKICKSNQRGDLELGANNHTQSESGKKFHSCGANLGHYVDEYCAKSTINGVQYFGERRTAMEKIWWAISITVSLCCGLWFIVRSYEKWENSPVIVNFATKETPIWHLPFPAVTICPYSKVAKSHYDYSDYLDRRAGLENLTDEERRKLFYMDIICRAVYSDSVTADKTVNETMLDLFREVQPTFHDNAFDCQYGRTPLKCSKLFVPIFTDHGICYTFNLMDRTQILSDGVVHYKNFHRTTTSNLWSIEDGYNKSAGMITYPQRAHNSGDNNALEIKLKVNIADLDYMCGGSLNGFKVHIASPHTMPRIKQQHVVVPFGKLVKIEVTPEITTTSKEVKGYDPERRNCYLPSERQLKYFKIYTQNNCDIECISNVIIENCGCALFYMPRYNSTPICGPRSGFCVRNSQILNINKEYAKKIPLMEGKEPDLHPIECGCLPDCISMQFHTENTQVDWNWRKEYELKKELAYSGGRRIFLQADANNKNIEVSMLQVFFKKRQFVTSERNELYSTAEFVANVGGLLGLFIGITALSFVEIVYYMTLRILCNIRMFGKGNWSGNTDQ